MSKLKYENRVKEIINENIRLKMGLLESETMLSEINDIVSLCIKAFQNDGKIFIFGNGGSASDALHMAGELLGRFQQERRSYPAIALNADVASMTAIANDYGYEHIFSRQLEGLITSKYDIVFGISTSGNSKNVYNALHYAKLKNITTVGLLGSDGGFIKDVVDKVVIIPSLSSARIQECHITIIHIICELIEHELKKEKEETLQ